MLTKETKEKLDHVLLVDDEEPYNFLHKKVISMIDCIKEVSSFYLATDALSYLIDLMEKEKKWPDVILVDINMPGMSGWEFVEKMKEINGQAEDLIIYMLSSSINPDDHEKAANSNFVKGFISKPLSGEKMNDILFTHFQETIL